MEKDGEKLGTDQNLEQIAKLEDENEYLKAKILKLEAVSTEAEKTLENAKIEAEKITAAAKLEFDTEVDRLRLFKGRWDNFVKGITEKFSNDERLIKLNALILTLDGIFADNVSENGCDISSEEKIAQAKKLLSENKDLGKSKISKIRLGDDKNGFDLDEVLNPKEIPDLYKLCKEMGLTED